MVFRFCIVLLCASVVTSTVRVVEFFDGIDLGFYPTELQRHFSRSHGVNCLFLTGIHLTIEIDVLFDLRWLCEFIVIG